MNLEELKIKANQGNVEAQYNLGLHFYERQIYKDAT